jgi:hypothetical protein
MFGIQRAAGKQLRALNWLKLSELTQKLKKLFSLLIEKDLNTQTSNEFNKFEKNCFVGTSTGRDLIPAL